MRRKRAFTGKSGPFSYNNEQEIAHAKDAGPDFIESTAGEVAAELAHRGIRADQRITVMIEPAESDDWIAKACAYARAKVMEEDWSDANIDRIIKEERRAVQPQHV
jgi:hypothetical protein